MNEKEVSELRRRFRPDKSAISRVVGCYVNEKGEIIAQFDQSLGLMSQEESEAILQTLRKSLTGSVGKNLLDIVFDTRQVVDSDEHRLLTALRDSELKDREALQTFFQRVSQSVALEGNYMILLARDAYDVPYRSGDGEKQADASAEVFSYILCSICPVKLTKAALSYLVRENEFHTLKPEWVMSAPELGFLFPAFNDRSADLYGALYYSRDLGDTHGAFVNAVFHQEPPMPATAQKETFQTLLGEALAEDCNFDVVQSVNEEMRLRIAAHKESGETQPLTVSGGEVKNILRSCGVSESNATSFEVQYGGAFGEDAVLSPKNLVDTKQIEVRTPDVVIKVNPDRSDLLETRIINGAKYILIRADDGVEVDGVPISRFGESGQ